MNGGNHNPGPLPGAGAVANGGRLLRRLISIMDASHPLHPAYVPKGLSPERARQWCLQRTRLDYQRSVRRGRPMSGPTRRRLLQRRWWRIKTI